MKKPQGFGRRLSRKDIIAFMLEHQDYHRWNEGYYPIAWNIKMYGTWEWSLGRGYQGETWGTENDERFDDKWREYTEENHEFFWWAAEDALDGIAGDPKHRNYNFFAGHWDPDLDLKDDRFVIYQTGRSGGWLVLDEWEGNNFHRVDPDDLVEWCTEMDYKSLWAFYKFVVEIDRAVENRYAEMAYQYTWRRADMEVEWLEEEREDEALAELEIGPGPFNPLGGW